METKRTRIGTILLGVGLVLIAAAWATAQEQSGSVLSRLQTVDDPELGELIRVAIDNYRRVYVSGPESEEEFKIVRDVTESYARITLLDRQIEQTQRRIEQVSAADVRQEMILAQAELESTRTMELANLREIMRIIPAHAFGRRPVDQLKGWLALDVLDKETVVVYEGRQPFSERRMGHTLAGVMSPAKAVDYVADQMKDSQRLPIRVDIHRTVAGLEASDGVEKGIVAAVRRSGLQMRAEVHLTESVRQRRAFAGLHVLGDQVGTNRQIANGLPRLGGIIEPNEWVERQLSTPGQLPITIALDYDPASEAALDRLAQTIAEAAQRLEIARLVEVTRTLHPPEPETQYLGEWEATMEGEAVRITIEPRQRMRVVEIDNGRITSQRTGRWSLEGDRIAATVGGEMMTGTIDESGDLIFESGSERVVFKKRCN